MKKSFLALAVAVIAIPFEIAMPQARADSIVLRPLATRPSLEAAERQLSVAGVSDSTSVALLQRVRARLRDGDFRPRDLVILDVQGEPALTDTFFVGADRTLELPSPTVGKLELQGVLRAELEPAMTEFVRRFIRDARVRVQPMVRISVQGEVTRAGIYGVPANALVSDALMAAGGTTSAADMTKAHVERGGTKIWTAADLDAAIANGRTIDESMLRDGDQIYIQKKKAGGMETNIRFMGIIVGILGGLYGLSRAL